MFAFCSVLPANVHGVPAVFHSDAVRSVLEMARRIAPTNVAVLVTGESGVGKELIARAVHHYSLRSVQPFIDVSCAALPEHLVESELFGYEKGAFSGAQTSKPGLFELAHGGTLFLDEIGELDLKTQTKLLRVLDGMPFYRLGSTRKSVADARIVAATNCDLLAASRTGKFREDLYHRLSQFTIVVPPLRERLADILPLAYFFLSSQFPDHRFSAAAVEALQQYRWPGNVRELRNVVVKAAVLAQGVEIGPGDLHLETPAADPVPVINTAQDVRPSHLDTVERDVIFRTLARAGGHQQRAAQMLGISRRTLSRRLKAYQQE